MNQEERIRQFVEEIWSWYERHKRELPWRDLAIADDTQRAYMVWVSEVMLQQTQVSRVKIVFKNFLERFPTIADLARATNKDVILAWRGMGYNSRALRLRDAAYIVVTQCDGVFPFSFEELRSIKGIGPYTAAAIRNFAFNLPTPCIDTNIRRILHRTFVGPEAVDGTWKMNDTELLRIAENVLRIAIDSTGGSAPHDAANWHAALMDFGSLVQTKSAPKWEVCPLTAKGIMLTTPANWVAPVRGAAKAKERREPGRFEGAAYVPNRIFRGRIVEVLRDSEKGIGLDELGPMICNDWEENHKEWLKSLITKLVQDRLIAQRHNAYVLAE